MKYLYIPFLLFLLASCNMKSEKKLSVYFDTDSLMHAQKDLLLEKKATIDKWATLEGNTSRGTVVPDSAKAWENEFQIFEKININKPGLKGVYTIREYDDDRSNLKIREYSTKKKNVDVPFLRLYYLDTPANLRKIEAQYRENNPVYKSKRHLEMIFDDFTGVALLHKYIITGTQKMVLKDSVKFEIKAEVKL